MDTIEEKIGRRIISIDAATKSLAIACLEFHDADEQLRRIINIGKDMANAPPPAEIVAIYNPITIKLFQVVDLIPNQKVAKCGLVQRSVALMKFIHKFTKDLAEDGWFNESVQIIIEFQMGPNRKSGDIQTQLIYHFLQFLPPENIHIVRPSLKNKLYFKSDPNSLHEAHKAQYTKLYTGNKSHTKYILLEWLNAYGQMAHLAQIGKKNYADIADAFCQAAAWDLANK